jgi:GTP:adenosylcobinamide-phosphate guanylyltransferase
MNNKFVFNATFNNMSVMWWRSVLLVEEIGENHQPVASHLLKVALKTIKTKRKIYINDFCAIHRLATGSFLIINVL